MASRQERFQMRQRGAGARQLQDDDFGLSLPGFSAASEAPNLSAPTAPPEIQAETAPSIVGLEATGTAAQHAKRSLAARSASAERRPLVTQDLPGTERDSSDSQQATQVDENGSATKKRKTSPSALERTPARRNTAPDSNLPKLSSGKRKKRKSIGQQSMRRKRSSLRLVVNAIEEVDGLEQSSERGQSPRDKEEEGRVHVPQPTEAVNEPEPIPDVGAVSPASAQEGLHGSGHSPDSSGEEALTNDETPGSGQTGPTKPRRTPNRLASETLFVSPDVSAVSTPHETITEEDKPQEEHEGQQAQESGDTRQDIETDPDESIQQNGVPSANDADEDDELDNSPDRVHSLLQAEGGDKSVQAVVNEAEEEPQYAAEVSPAMPPKRRGRPAKKIALPQKDRPKQSSAEQRGQKRKEAVAQDDDNEALPETSLVTDVETAAAESQGAGRRPGRPRKALVLTSSQPVDFEEPRKDKASKRTTRESTTPSVKTAAKSSKRSAKSNQTPDMDDPAPEPEFDAAMRAKAFPFQTHPLVPSDFFFDVEETTSSRLPPLISEDASSKQAPSAPEVFAQISGEIVQKTQSQLAHLSNEEQLPRAVIKRQQGALKALGNELVRRLRDVSRVLRANSAMARRIKHGKRAKKELLQEVLALRKERTDAEIEVYHQAKKQDLARTVGKEDSNMSKILEGLERARRKGGGGSKGQKMVGVEFEFRMAAARGSHDSTGRANAMEKIKSLHDVLGKAVNEL